MAHISQFPLKIGLLLCLGGGGALSAWGCTYNFFPVNLAPKFSSPPWVVHVHSVHAPWLRQCWRAILHKSWPCII